MLQFKTRNVHAPENLYFNEIWAEIAYTVSSITDSKQMLAEERTKCSKLYKILSFCCSHKRDLNLVYFTEKKIPPSFLYSLKDN